MTALESGTRQTVSSVFGAEARRMGRRGGLRTNLIASASAGVALGMVSLVGMIWASESRERVWATSSMELAIVVTTLLIMVGASLLGSRDSAHSGSAAVLVPQRTRLLVGRMAAVAALAAATGAVVAAVTGGVGALIVADAGVLPPVASAVVLAAALSASTATVAYALSSILRGFGAAILVSLVLFVIAPLLLALGSGVLPAPFSGLGTTIGDLLPLALLVKAIGVTPVATTGVGPILLGQVGLMLWAGVLAWIAIARFRVQDLA